MQCPFCDTPDTKVIDSRISVEGQVRRRRECTHCLERFTTYESIELSFPRIVKRDGTFEQFREEKLRSGLIRAIEKREVKIEDLNIAISKIIRKIQVCGDRELPSKSIGDWVMSALKELDEVAYLRFASVYLRFRSAHDFNKILSEFS